MVEQKNKEKTFNFRLNIELKNKFENYCKTNGFSISKRIRILIENDLKNGHK